MPGLVQLGWQRPVGLPGLAEPVGLPGLAGMGYSLPVLMLDSVEPAAEQPLWPGIGIAPHSPRPAGGFLPLAPPVRHCAHCLPQPHLRPLAQLRLPAGLYLLGLGRLMTVRAPAGYVADLGQLPPVYQGFERPVVLSVLPDVALLPLSAAPSQPALGAHWPLAEDRLLRPGQLPPPDQLMIQLATGHYPLGLPLMRLHQRLIPIQMHPMPLPVQAPVQRYAGSLLRWLQAVRLRLLLLRQSPTGELLNLPVAFLPHPPHHRLLHRRHRHPGLGCP